MVNEQPSDQMISADTIIGIHNILVEWFADAEDPISPPGVKDLGLIESAAGRPFQTVGGAPAYSSIFSQSAALFHSLINNHGFHNGNKRIALVCGQVLLNQNGLWMERPSDDELFLFAKNAAAHELTEDRASEVEYISEWFDSQTRKVVKGEHPLKYGALKSALERFGYTIDPPEGTLLNIYKDGLVVERIIKQGIQGFRPYHTDYISGLRKRLGLTAENGIDSARFYGERGAYDVASDFIELRIEVMRRLAKT